MGNEGLRALEGKNALFAATGQIQLLHAQTQLMELHLLQLIHGYASGVENFGMRRFVADELGLLLGVSSRSAQLMIDDAAMLVDHPALLAKVADGQWTLKHAHAALDVLAGAGLDREQQDQAVALVLSQGVRTPWEVRKAMQAAVLILDPEAAERRHEKAVADRGVRTDTFNETGYFTAHGSVSQVRSLMAALEAQVGPAGPEETRSRSQRLFDALMDLVCGRVEPGQWQAYVVMTLDTLTGNTEQPAEIPGLGLIPANEARDLAHRAELRRVVVNEHGELADIDSTLHRPDNPPTADAPAHAAERLISLQTEDPVDDAIPDVDEADLAWHRQQLDADTEAHADTAAPSDAAADSEANDLEPHAEVDELCPEAFDRALQGLLEEGLSDVLTQAVLGGLVPAGSVVFETDGYQHGRHGPPGPTGTSGPGDGPPTPDPPPDNKPPSSGPSSGGPPPDGGLPGAAPPPDGGLASGRPPNGRRYLDGRRSPPAPPGPPPGGQLDPDTPPSAGDLAWADDTTDYHAFDASLNAQVPARRYQREPGSRQGGATIANGRFWTPTGLNAALDRMLTSKLNPRPLSSVSYALPPRMARFIKARDITCTFPSCRLLSQNCQNDHIDPWPHGKTEEPNIDSKCTHHHQSKTMRYFHVRKDQHGVHWTTPAGRTYTRPPRPLLRGW